MLTISPSVFALRQIHLITRLPAQTALIRHPLDARALVRGRHYNRNAVPTFCTLHFALCIQIGKLQFVEKHSTQKEHLPFLVNAPFLFVKNKFRSTHTLGPDTAVTLFLLLSFCSFRSYLLHLNRLAYALSLMMY